MAKNSHGTASRRNDMNITAEVVCTSLREVNLATSHPITCLEISGRASWRVRPWDVLARRTSSDVPRKRGCKSEWSLKMRAQEFPAQRAGQPRDPTSE